MRFLVNIKHQKSTMISLLRIKYYIYMCNLSLYYDVHYCASDTFDFH